MRILMNYLFKFLCLVLATVFLTANVAAQTPSRYVYDENGRLCAVIVPDGGAGVYGYYPAQSWQFDG